MNFGRRLRLFMLGLGLGTIVSFMIFGKSCTNMAWAPEARVQLRMRTTLVHATPRAQAAMDALGIDLAALRAGMDSLAVGFGKSRRTDDSLYYELVRAGDNASNAQATLNAGKLDDPVLASAIVQVLNAKKVTIIPEVMI